MTHDPQIFHSRTLLGLRRIHDPNISGVTAPWTPSEGMIKFLDWLPKGQAPQKISINPKDQNDMATAIRGVMGKEADQFYDKYNPYWAFFIKDIQRLVTLYAAITGLKYTSVNLRNQKQFGGHFHVDGAPLRFAITYRGAGTKYLSPCEKYRRGDFMFTKDSGTYDPEHVRHVGACQILAMKGSLHPLNKAPLLVHGDPRPGANNLDDDRFFVLISGGDTDTLKAKAQSYMRRQPSP